MSRRTPLLLVSLAAACALAACQSAAPATQPTGQPGPTASTAPAASTSPQTPAGQPTAGGGGGGGGGGGAVLPEGSWSAGSAHLVVSGDYSGTYDIPLSPFTSLSTAETTLLNYLSESPQASLAVSIDPGFVALVVTTGEFVGGAGTTDNAPCDTTFSRADATAVEGTVRCQNASVISAAGGLADRHVNLEVSFSATR